MRPKEKKTALCRRFWPLRCPLTTEFIIRSVEPPYRISLAFPGCPREFEFTKLSQYNAVNRRIERYFALPPKANGYTLNGIKSRKVRDVPSSLKTKAALERPFTTPRYLPRASLVEEEGHCEDLARHSSK